MKKRGVKLNALGYPLFVSMPDRWKRFKGPWEVVSRRVREGNVPGLLLALALIFWWNGIPNGRRKMP